MSGDYVWIKVSGEREQDSMVRLEGGQYILVSFEVAPAVIFCTRSWDSSDLSSSSCFLRSSFDLPHNGPVLSFAEDYCPQTWPVSELSHQRYRLSPHLAWTHHCVIEWRSSLGPIWCFRAWILMSHDVINKFWRGSGARVRSPNCSLTPDAPAATETSTLPRRCHKSWRGQ